MDVAWAERYLRESASALFHRLSAIGVHWVALHLHEGNRVPRWHAPEGGGKRVMALCAERAMTMPGITWRFGHRARGLIRTGGRITGVEATCRERSVEISAPVIVVATGGFQQLARAHRRPRRRRAPERSGSSSAAGPSERGRHPDAGEHRGPVHGARFRLDVIRTGRPTTFARTRVAVSPCATSTTRSGSTTRGRGSMTRACAAERPGPPHFSPSPTDVRWSVLDAVAASQMTIADPHYLDGGITIRERVDEFLLHAASCPYGLECRRSARGADRGRPPQSPRRRSPT